MKVTGMNRTTEQRNLLRIYSIDKKENGICLQICSNKTEEKIEESQKKGDSDMAEFDYEVVNGRKIRVRPVETVSEVDENGYFVRQPNHFTEGFGEGKNPVEAGRYRLVWAKLCHWSNRASIVIELLGLDEAISVNMVDHAEHEKNLGWEFVYDKDNVDPVLDMTYFQALRRVILPEAIVVALPSLGNSFIGLIKGTSLAFVCAVVEMTAAGKIIAGRTYRYFEVYVSLAIIYWIITIIVEQGIKLIEKKIRIPENAPAIQTDEGALNQ